jgi:imidazolonepropionase-like amidohydrolase
VAIRNARIVPVSGPILAKGTVVIRDGLIEAVGENVQAPADAAVVDGEGMTVYPGLVDGLSTWGMGEAGAAATAAGGRGGRGAATPATPAPAGATPAAATPARGPEDRPQTTSWLKAADELQPTDRRIPTARAAGFTTAVTFPTRGIFGGQGAIIDLLTGETAGDMVIMPAAGQYIALGRGGGGFPSSLMGTIAYIRQVYLDAGHYQLVKDAYAKSPVGMERPAYDRALEGVLESKRILLPANRLVEIDRMIHFAAELKQPVILYGMQEAYRPEAVELLKKANVPALVSLKWPEPPRDPDPELVESLRTLQTRDQAAAAPLALKKAGVQFAFYSDGVDAARDLQRAVKKAMDAGLSREDALRALTLSPAEIYGVADRLGSIDKGKIGNLVVTRGDIFDDRTRVEMIFVDGVKFIPPPEAPAGGRGGAAATDNPGGVR